MKVGKLADMVIVSHSPLDAGESIAEIKVLETIIGGETVFDADAP